MSGVVLHEFGQAYDELRFEPTEPAELGPGDVAIEVAACGLNFPDLLVVQGTYQTLPELPFVPGKELAGTVTEVGSAVSRFAVGDRVMAQVEHGAFVERAVVAEQRCFPIPDDFGFDEAAAFGLVYSTAYFALLRRGRYREGETVLVTAANGSVGSAAVQLASSLGAKTIAVVRSEAAVPAARQDGAEHVIVAADPSGLREQVRALTDGRGADVVIESVGGEHFAACLRAIAWEGRIVTLGFAGGQIPTIKAGHLLVKNVEVTGLEMHGYQTREPAHLAEAFARILALRDDGKVQIRVAHRFDISEPGPAFATLAAGNLAGRVVFTTAAAR